VVLGVIWRSRCSSWRALSCCSCAWPACTRSSQGGSLQSYVQVVQVAFKVATVQLVTQYAQGLVVGGGWMIG
jgi:hypothetical protein